MLSSLIHYSDYLGKHFGNKIWADTVEAVVVLPQE